MGTFVYDTTLEIAFDDRLLMHVQIVIGVKLRRGESFYFSWKNDDESGDGRSVVWLHPAIPLVYRYDEAQPPSINPLWIQALDRTAHTNAGLQIVPEPDLPEKPTATPSV